MAIEKKWESIPATSFSTNGTSAGLVTIPSTIGFKVKQEVLVKATGENTLPLQVKRVLSPTQLIVGPRTAPLTAVTDLTLYTTLKTSSIEAPEQGRPSIPIQELERASFEEEPTVAKRTLLVDAWGRVFTPSNPLPVQLSDGSITIETLNANLAVQLSDKDNYPESGDVHDSVRIGNGTNELLVNPDGSINTNLMLSNPGELLSYYNEASSVAAAAPTAILTFTAPVGRVTYLQKIEVSGTNIAEYWLAINGVTQDKKRTYFSGPLNEKFSYAELGTGLKLEVGDVVVVMVTHSRPDLGDFNGRIQVVEI